MASSPVLIVAVQNVDPKVVDASDPTLVGQVILDYITANPTNPGFSVDVKTGLLETA